MLTVSLPGSQVPRYSTEDSLGVSLRVSPDEISMHMDGLSIKQVASPVLGGSSAFNVLRVRRKGNLGPFSLTAEPGP